MAIYNDVSSLLGRLAKQPLSNTYDDKSIQTLPSQESEDKSVRPAVGKRSFSGSGLNLELSLASGQEIDLEIKINQAGGVSQLELTSSAELSLDDQEKLKKFLAQLSQSIDILFSEDVGGKDLFKFANENGIMDVDLTAYQDNGRIKHGIEFEKEGRGSGRKVEAEWYRYDRDDGTEENHDLSLKKQGKREDQTAIYGQINYQWLIDQVDTAMSAMDDQKQGAKLSAFFNSGIQALFSTARSGSDLLQELGANSQQAKDFIGKSIKVLASEHAGQKSSPSLHQQRQMNSLPDFSMDFSSKRTVTGSSDKEYQLNMDITQVSHQIKNSQKDESYQTQNRHLRMDYQSTRQKAVYEYTWTRDESVRNVFEGGRLASSHYRIEEQVQAQLIEGVENNVNDEKNLNYSDREDIKYL